MLTTHKSTFIFCKDLHKNHIKVNNLSIIYNEITNELEVIVFEKVEMQVAMFLNYDFVRVPLICLFAFGKYSF
jgi:hypothetical protein